MSKLLLKAALLTTLVFLGALFWAGQRDPFHRVWFKAHHPEGAASCVAVLPKTQSGPLPVVIYLHGSGGSVQGSGNDLRAIAEMGIAAVGMDYCQTNGARFEAEFTALLDYVRRQRWADTNRIAWLGYSFGAQRQLSYALQHPQRSPALLARLGGGVVPELETSQSNRSQLSPQTKVLILHGKLDEVFPIADAEKLAAILRAQGASVDYRIWEEQGHGLGENRAVVFRFLGEYFLKELAGDGALRAYRSVHSWQKAAKPLWLYLLPALAAAVWFLVRGRLDRNERPTSNIEGSEPDVEHPALQAEGGSGAFHRVPGSPGSGDIPGQKRFGEDAEVSPVRRLGKGDVKVVPAMRLLWTAAVLLAVAAVGQVSLRWVLPRLHATPRHITLARMALVQERERADFDYLTREHATGRQKIGPLVEHAHLASYTRPLLNWKMDDPLYRAYVLSPGISAADGAMDWRRTLWESFYPRIRNAPDTQTAAAAIARHLRERITIAPGADWPSSVTDIWDKQITGAEGFSTIHVAALRACGVPARMGPSGNAEFWTGTEWAAVPASRL